MNIEQLKARILELSASDRIALADWILKSPDVCEFQREALLREIQLGIDEADRGELIDSEVAFDSLRNGLEERAARGDWEDFDRIMARVPDVPPLPGDER